MSGNAGGALLVDTGLGRPGSSRHLPDGGLRLGPPDEMAELLLGLAR
jgi:hypothetical protein